MRMLAPAFSELPNLATVAIPVKDPKTGGEKELHLDIQYPHDVFAHYATKPAEFHQLFGTPAEIQDFWQKKDLSDPGFKSHPAVKKQGFKELCVPLKLHSDGVVLSRHETLHVISWSSQKEGRCCLQH